MLRIKVDTQLCSGHARCAAVAAEVYRLDDDGYCISDGDTIAPEHEALARRGARACPERAIEIEEIAA